MGYSEGSTLFLGQKVLDLTYATTVGIGATVVLDIRPPKGLVYKIRNLYIKVEKPPSAGSGTHSVKLHASAGDLAILWGSQVFGSSIRLDYSKWTTINTGVPKEEVTLLAMQSVAANYENYLQLSYENDTNVVQTEDLDVFVYVEVYKEV